MKGIRTQKLADMLGVTPQTIRKYVREEQIPFHKNPSGQLFFTEKDVQEIIGTDSSQEEEKVWAHYIRSSSGSVEEINSQKEKLINYYGEAEYVVVDKASGMNEKRKGLFKLIKLAQQGAITDIAVTRDDRLSRFGNKYLFELFSQNNVEIHCLSEKKDSSIEEEIIADLMTIIASFSGRYSQLKSKEAKRKLINKAGELIDE